MTSSPTANREIDDIRDTLMHASLCHEAWWIFQGVHPMRDDIISVYNRYLHFFETIRPALFVNYVLKLSSLFDRFNDKISLLSIPDVEADPRFSDLWTRGRRLYQYRSKVIAHRDRQSDSRDFARETGFTPNDIRAILDDARSIFDDAASRLNMAPVPSFSCSDDLLGLISDLKEHNASLL
jgi:AbiU2